MSAAAGPLVEAGILGLGLVLLVFGAALLVRLRRRGGLEMALAHMLADRPSRQRFLAGLCLSLGSLFGIGLVIGLGAVASLPDRGAFDAETGLFILGAAGMLVLMVNALRAPGPTLQEGWILEETAGRVSNAALPGTPGAVAGTFLDPTAHPRIGRAR